MISGRTLLMISPSSALVTLLLPAATERFIKSQVSWSARDGARNATFSLTLEASVVPLLASLSPTAISAYGESALTFIVAAFSFLSVARDWTCSFSFVNVTAQAVFRIDSTTVNVQCVAPLNIQAIAASQTLSCALLYQASGVYTLPFDLTFSAPPLPSLSFADDNAQIMADSASVFVRNFTPFSSIDLMRIFIGSVRVAVRSFIVRSGVLQLQFSVSCSECNCCSGQSFSLTVSHTQFPMMSARASVVLVDPNAPSVLNVDPSIIPASGGAIVEIAVKNFPSATSGVTVSVGNAAPAVAFQVVSVAGSAVTSVRFYSPVLPSALAHALAQAPPRVCARMPWPTPLPKRPLVSVPKCILAPPLLLHPVLHPKACQPHPRSCDVYCRCDALLHVILAARASAINQSFYCCSKSIVCVIVYARLASERDVSLVRKFPHCSQRRVVGMKKCEVAARKILRHKMHEITIPGS